MALGDMKFAFGGCVLLFSTLRDPKINDDLSYPLVNSHIAMGNGHL